MKRWLSKITVMASLVTLLICCGIIVAYGADAEIDVTDSEFGAVGTEEGNIDYAEQNRSAINRALEQALEDDESGYVTVTIPARQNEDSEKIDTYYYISGNLRIYSNTNLILDDKVTLVDLGDGSIIKGTHIDDGEETFCTADTGDGTECSTGGYDQIKNVSITGGTWVAGSAFNSDLNCQGIMFRHGTNITIKDLTVTGCTNHPINTSGCDTVNISGCTLENAVIYTGSDSDFWGGFNNSQRFITIEGIHLDFTNTEGEPPGKPNDDTPCKNVTIDNCTFTNIFCGVGTHHTNSQDASNIVIKNCIFNNLYNNFNDSLGQEKHYGNALNFQSVNGLEFIDNTITDVYSLGEIVTGKNITISDNTVNGINGNGVVIRSGSADVQIINNTFNEPKQSGIWLGDESIAKVNNNTLYECTNNGIHLESGSQVAASGNEIIEPGIHGIYLKGASMATATGNIISGPGNSGIYGAEGSVVTATSENKIISPAQYGFFINASTATISGNEISYPNVGGIGADAASTLTAESNIITDPITVGIYVRGSGANLTANNIDNGQNGISAVGGSTLTAENNTISDSTIYGIYVNNSSTATLTGNEIKNSANGIGVNDASILTAEKNVISEAAGNGIYISGNSEGTLQENTIMDASKYGILMSGGNNLTVSGGRISWTASTGEGGISINANGSKAVIDSVTIENSPKFGIYAVPGNGSQSSLTLKNSTIKNSGTIGLRLGNIEAGVISGNKVSGSGGIGVYVTGDASGKGGLSITNNTSIENTGKDFNFENTDNIKKITFKNNKHGDSGFGTMPMTMDGSTHNVHYKLKNAIIISASNSVSGPIIKWNKDTSGHAVMYKIFRKTGSGSWALINTTKDATVVSYTDTSAVSGTSYTYVVTSVCDCNKNQNTAASDSDTKTITYIAAPKLSLATNTVSGVKLQWGKVNGAGGYKILRKTASGGLQEVATISGNGTVTYTDTSAVSGTKYTYIVRCINSSGNYVGSYYSAGKTITFIAAPRVASALNTVSGPKVTWNKINGAVAYRVMRKTENGSYTSIAVTTSTNYIDTTAKTGTKYTYAVRCCSTDGKSNHSSYYSAGKTVTFIAAPRVSAVTNTSTGPKITWNKIDGAVAYRVMRKTGSGSYTSIAVTTSNSYVDKTAANGTKYTYTVRCCTKDGKSNHSSYYDAGKTITCKK